MHPRTGRVIFGEVSRTFGRNCLSDDCAFSAIEVGFGVGEVFVPLFVNYSEGKEVAMHGFEFTSFLFSVTPPTLLFESEDLEGFFTEPLLDEDNERFVAIRWSDGFQRLEVFEADGVDESDERGVVAIVAFVFAATRALHASNYKGYETKQEEGQSKPPVVFIAMEDYTRDRN